DIRRATSTQEQSMACIRSCGTSPTLKSLARGHRQLKPELRLVFRRADISKGTYPSMEKDSLQCSGHWGGTLFDGGRVSACFEIGRTKMSLCRATLFALAAGTLLCTASYALDPLKNPVVRFLYFVSESSMDRPPSFRQRSPVLRPHLSSVKALRAKTGMRRSQQCSLPT